MRSYTEIQAESYRTMTLAEIITQLAPLAAEAEAIAAWTTNQWERNFATQMAASLRRGQFMSPKQCEVFLRIGRRYHRAA